MTGSTSSQIDDVVTLWNTGHHRKALAAMADPALVALVQAEVTRLETPGRRNLLDEERGDVVARHLHRSLVALLAAYAAQPA